MRSNHPQKTKSFDPRELAWFQVRAVSLAQRGENYLRVRNSNHEASRITQFIIRHKVQCLLVFRALYSYIKGYQVSCIDEE